MWGSFIFDSDNKHSLVNNSVYLVNKVSLFVFVFCMSFAGTGNPFKTVSIVLFIITGFLYIVKNKLWKSYSFNRTHIFLILLPLYYLSAFLYIPWDQDIDRMMWVQERKMSLLFVPIIILLIGMKPFRIKTMCNILILGCCVSILYVSFLVFKIDGLSSFNHFFVHFNHIRASQYSHHVPFNLLLNFSFVSIVYFIFNKINLNAFNLILYLIGIVMISLVLINTEGRAGLLSFLVMIPTVLFYYVYRWKKLIGILTLIICLSVGGCIFLNHPRVQSITKNNMGNGDSVGSIARLFIWKKSFDIIKEKPFIGYGIGTAQMKLNAEYKRVGYTSALKNNYHSHNQVLQSWSQLGLMGLLMIIYILFYPLYYFIAHNRNELILFLWIVFFIANITEPLLQVSFGVFPFCFLLFIMYCEKPITEKSKK